jgi:integrase
VASGAKLVRTRTPGVFRRGERYVVVYRDNMRKQRKRSARTLKEAKLLKAALTTDVDRGEHRELSRLTFAEFAPNWIETYRGRNRHGRLISDETRDDYRGALEREAIPFFGACRLVDVTPQDALEFLGYLEKPQPHRHPHPRPAGLSPASVRKMVAPVRCLFADARDHGLIRFDPIAGLRIGTPDVEINGDEQEENTKALTPAELERLLAEIPGEWREFFDFLYETACRIGEAIEVRYGDVDTGTRRLHVQRRYYRGKVKKPKGRKTRHVPLSRARARALWARAEKAPDDELVYTSTGGKRIDPHNLAVRVLKPAAVRAGLGEWIVEEGWVYDKHGARRRRKPRAESWVHLHTFRHTRATDLFLEEGWPIEDVSKFLGHASAEFTRRVYVWDRNTTPMPELPEDRVATEGATRPHQTGLEPVAAAAEEIPGFPAGTRTAEVAAAYS